METKLNISSRGMYKEHTKERKRHFHYAQNEWKWAFTSCAYTPERKRFSVIRKTDFAHLTHVKWDLKWNIIYGKIFILLMENSWIIFSAAWMNRIIIVIVWHETHIIIIPQGNHLITRKKNTRSNLLRHESEPSSRLSKFSMNSRFLTRLVLKFVVNVESL